MILGKITVFAECQILALGKSSVICPVPSWRLKFAERRALRSAKALPSARRNALGKVPFADNLSSVCPLPSATLGKVFAECFLSFAEYFLHSAN
jgi:hypothetical protein